MDSQILYPILVIRVKVHIIMSFAEKNSNKDHGYKHPLQSLKFSASFLNCGPVLCMYLVVWAINDKEGVL